MIRLLLRQQESERHLILTLLPRQRIEILATVSAHVCVCLHKRVSLYPGSSRLTCCQVGRAGVFLYTSSLRSTTLASRGTSCSSNSLKGKKELFQKIVLSVSRCGSESTLITGKQHDHRGVRHCLNKNISTADLTISEKAGERFASALCWNQYAEELASTGIDHICPGCAVFALYC